MGNMKLDGLILTVVDPRYPQYDGTYRLSAAQADGIREIVRAQDIEIMRDWLDNNGDQVEMIR